MADVLMRVARWMGLYERRLARSAAFSGQACMEDGEGGDVGGGGPYVTRRRRWVRRLWFDHA